MRKVFTLSLFILLNFNLSGQELIISPLSSNPILVKQFEEGNLQMPYQKLNCSLHLPFIDDFSKNHQPGADLQHCDDNFVFINPTFGVNPPTIGVATFEGLDFNGYPYDFDNPSAYGDADILTSCTINLEEEEDGTPYQISDDIILSFYYQPQGNGFAPRSQDSLVLEFYDVDLEAWVKQWSKPGSALHDFELAFIPILEDRYLRSEFKFRFRNKGRLSGNLDHWNIDMVWMDKNRTSGDLFFQDVGYQYPVNNLMNNYTAIPYKHYKSSASAHMIDTVLARLRNNDDDAINLSNVKMRNFSEGVLVNESTFGNTVNFSAQSSKSFEIPVIGTGNGYVFNPNIDEPFVSFDNEFVMSSGTFDLVSDNDTINFTQYFENYYAYDDGSAEAGLGFTSAGGQLAIKYQALQADSLIGYKIYFNPIFDNPVFPFIMIVWDVDENLPGDEIYVNQTFTSVEFIQEGHDIFAYYFFDSAVYVSGTYFVGVAQTSDISLSIGYDRSTDNIQNIFFKTGFSWQEFPDSDPGSVMIRPVFTSELDSIIMGVSKLKIIPAFSVYPNPAYDWIKIVTLNSERLDISLLSIDGKVILNKRIINEIEIDVSDIQSGMYLIKAVNDKGLVKVEKILINH